tara:strand:+ start:49 stop:738 length:690 start_codon:yes stop_codon:yes gene_type:complete
MIEYENLILIGTSHIAIDSVREVKKVIKDLEPEYVALELDKGRFLSLMSNQKRRLRLKDVMKLGVRGFLFNLAGAWVEEKLGKVVKVKPGTEMKQAVISAAKIKAKVVLIDQNISITIKNLVKGFGFREKWRFCVDIVKGILFRKKMMAEQGLGEVDLRKVPSDEMIKKIVKRVEVRYPSIYKALIGDRNKIMAKKLVKLMKRDKNSKIVAVVGAGHVDGMLEIIKKSI